jgi:putative endonuclease
MRALEPCDPSQTSHRPNLYKLCHPECGAIFRDERSPSRGSLRFRFQHARIFFHVYILQSASRRALYIGMTNNLRRRVFQHKTHQFEGFTGDYNAIRLVYWEKFGSVEKAIAREKQLKRWRREKKIWLVESVNPKWRDLALEWYPQVDVAQDGLATASSTQGLSTTRPVRFADDRLRSR